MNPGFLSAPVPSSESGLPGDEFDLDEREGRAGFLEPVLPPDPEESAFF